MVKVKTSVIGSYPVKIDTFKLIKNYFNSVDISWDTYIDSAVDDMLNANLDYISDGQTRDPFINIFTRKIKGCRIRFTTEIIDKLEYDKPIILDDIIYVKNKIPPNKFLIGVVAGPYTLSKSVVDYYYKNVMDLSYDFAKIINKEIKLLLPYIDIISIDEPYFSNNFPEYGKDLISFLTNRINCPIRLHVCGDVSKIIPQLLDLPIDILSHEFKARPELLNDFKEYTTNNKKICLGSVRSDNQKIETVDEIISHIKIAESIFGNKLEQISPDCGLRFLPRSIAFNKLKNLVRAGEIFNEN